MQVIIKTLQQTKHPLEVEPSNTIAAVKEMVQKLLQHPAEQQKLIFSGKILNDSQTLEELAVKDGDFFVLMVTKAVTKTTTPAPTPATAVPTPAATKPKSPVKTPAAPSQSSASATVSATPASPSPAASTATASGTASTLVSGSQFEETVMSLMEMGFERPQILVALKAAFNNPDRAVEYLMNGIPANLTGASSGAAAAPAAVDGAAVAEDDDMEEGEGELDEGAFSALNSNPQLAQLRQLIRAQPQLLEPILQQLGQSNPQLMQMIGANPEAFMNWLESDGGASTGGAGAEEGQHVVRLTQEEMAAVDRLTALGFDKQSAVEAYLACDKNEELAANYLFDSQMQ